MKKFLSSFISIGFLAFILSSCGGGEKKDNQKKDSLKNDNKLINIKVKKLESSGFLKSGKDEYKVENVIDNNIKTWWTPSPNRQGKGTHITFYFDKESEMNCMDILGGSHDPNFPQYGDIFKLNNRVKVASLEFSGGEKYYFILNDEDEMQHVTFPKVSALYATIRIEVVYPGSKWHDLCISEVKFMNDNTKNKAKGIEVKPYDKEEIMDLSYEVFEGSFIKGEGGGPYCIVTYTFQDEHGKQMQLMERDDAVENNYKKFEGVKQGLINYVKPDYDNYECTTNKAKKGKKFKVYYEYFFDPASKTEGTEAFSGNYVVKIKEL
jgi:hypothetical protein